MHFGQRLQPQNPATEAINHAIKSKFQTPYANWTEVKDDKAGWNQFWNGFRSKVTWHKAHTDAIRDIFNKKAFKRLSRLLSTAREKIEKDPANPPTWLAGNSFPALKVKWNTLEYKEKCQKNKRNRQTDEAQRRCVHSGGSKSVGTLRIEFIRAHGRAPTFMEMNDLMHKYAESGEWTGTSAQEVARLTTIFIEEYDAEQQKLPPYMRDDDKIRRMQISYAFMASMAATVQGYSRLLWHRWRQRCRDQRKDHKVNNIPATPPPPPNNPSASQGYADQAGYRPDLTNLHNIDLNLGLPGYNHDDERLLNLSLEDIGRILEDEPIHIQGFDPIVQPCGGRGGATSGRGGRGGSGERGGRGGNGERCKSSNTNTINVHQSFNQGEARNNINVHQNFNAYQGLYRNEGFNQGDRRQAQRPLIINEGGGGRRGRVRETNASKNCSGKGKQILTQSEPEEDDGY
ncbi:hypothetical protein TSUD_153850 [Trifolium subterraneum]|uniref:Uncharacterized protein n=1 Tax=Trifolium subterraneum TaxID=3900 RepID=A0A2Z6NBC8_TRISU|nr:hypothetical protein TSUD_153850 [Trifolium subterraneum]